MFSPKKISVFDVDYPVDGRRRECSYAEISSCPICHYSIVPTAVTGSYTRTTEMRNGDNIYEINILFLCPSCRNVFLAKYQGYSATTGLIANSMLAVSPISPNGHDFTDAIKSMSPMFTITYNQSAEAESRNLTEVAGCGYRKSVEYLVKDYLCKKFPEDAEAIKKELLGAAIKRIGDSRIKTLAERSVWIGNDETHYVKKHENLDIEDMKRFISAMLHYIDAELALEEALSISPAK